MRINSLNNKYNEGKLISFEGGEGVGKSTQIKLLKSYLLENNFKVLTTREPGGTEEGEIIRKFLVSGAKNTFDPLSELLIFNALRREHINKVINPSIKKGKIVLCDRFIDSTFVYQGIGKGINKKVLLNLHKKFCYDIYPDITFFLNLDPKIGLDRTNRRKNNETRFERLGLSYHKKVFNGYLKLSKKFEKRIININAQQSIKEISEKIIKHVMSIL